MRQFFNNNDKYNIIYTDFLLLLRWLNDTLSYMRYHPSEAMTWTHILRGESLVKEVIAGRMEGKRRRGKPRIMLLADIKTDEQY